MNLNEVFHLIDCQIIYIYTIGYDGFKMFNMSDPLDCNDAEEYLAINGNKEVRSFHYYASGDTIPTFHIFLNEEDDHEERD